LEETILDAFPERKGNDVQYKNHEDHGLAPILLRSPCDGGSQAQKTAMMVSYINSRKAEGAAVRQAVLEGAMTRPRKNWSYIVLATITELGCRRFDAC
jgi:hypothetical protein